MTNPNNTVRVRARLGGRASVLEANEWAQPFSTGLLDGNGVAQNTVADMNVLVGGTSSAPDVVIAANPAGYKIPLSLVEQAVLTITAPATDSRITSIVAYTDDLSLPSSDTTVTGNPSSCGLITVNGETAASPSAPSEEDIRAAITEDGATGSQAAYVVIATIKVTSSTTTITDELITIYRAGVGSDNVDWGTIEEVVSTYNGTVVGIKFANGLLVNTGRCYASNIAVNTSNGSIYTSGKYLPSYDYAVPFVERYGSALWGMSPGGWSGWVAHVENTNPLTNPGNVLFARGVSTNSGTFAAGCIAIGRWK